MATYIYRINVSKTSFVWFYIPVEVFVKYWYLIADIVNLVQKRHWFSKNKPERKWNKLLYLNSVSKLIS